MLGALESLIGRASVAKRQTIANPRDVNSRSNVTMEAGPRTVSRSAQIRTRTVSQPLQTRKGRSKKNAKETIKMPSGVTTNVQLDVLARRLALPNCLSPWIAMRGWDGLVQRGETPNYDGCI
ncbi:hypothetical protein G5I_01881 [Acromyrmex echinatior]|uniref:Uncharacterized protein n=1 Tax=Acromyrmex echinatior TaxID=103372 RepID=F4W8U4_ACREC|nr:hypothetical protein G5I_01881 [Acromyrmex echinatior]